ncbi:TPA: hypothetical protein I8045_002900 [Legionella pneumophila]|nr:hypothetical protein [Legionella pneumophila]
MPNIEIGYSRTLSVGQIAINFLGKTKISSTVAGKTSTALYLIIWIIGF